jgi:hypothetical protein
MAFLSNSLKSDLQKSIEATFQFPSDKTDSELEAAGLEKKSVIVDAKGSAYEMVRKRAVRCPKDIFMRKCLFQC